MPTVDPLEEFTRRHPYPDHLGLSSLYRFSSIPEKPEYLEALFLEGKLYHALPSGFNDPFECKPHFSWPKTAANVQAIRKHLIKVSKQQGKSRKEAKHLVSKSMKKPGFIEETIRKITEKVFGEIRICCFTQSNENLLFWAHYADSHSGFCVEYDATKLSINLAYKVAYQNDYPTVEYPRPNDARGFEPALVKSKEWGYEEEFRIIFVPEAPIQPKNDGKSLLLSGKEIRNVFFGAKIDAHEKEKIIQLIDKGPFNPGLWDTKLSRSSFELQFHQIR